VKTPYFNELISSCNNKPFALLRTQTNDGTTCIYYPNGQLAIIMANVFGFYIENTNWMPPSINIESRSQSRGSIYNQSSNGNNLNSSILNSLSGLPAASISSYAPYLSWLNIKDSFTTVVYDNINKSLNGRKTIETYNESEAKIRCVKEEIISNSNISMLSEWANTEENNLLALISSNGYCVCYGNKSKPK
jgi:hypothetical protein